MHGTFWLGIQPFLYNPGASLFGDCHENATLTALFSFSGLPASTGSPTRLNLWSAPTSSSPYATYLETLFWCTDAGFCGVKTTGSSYFRHSRLLRASVSNHLLRQVPIADRYPHFPPIPDMPCFFYQFVSPKSRISSSNSAQVPPFHRRRSSP